MTGFNKIFWGIILVLLDIRIQGFDILPDFIGYWIIYKGLKELVYLNSYFEKALKYVLPLALISVFDFYQIQILIEQNSFNPLETIFSILGIIITILNLLMFYNICTGISHAAQQRENPELAQKATSRWMLYLYTQIAGIVLTLLFLCPGFIAGLALMILMIVTFIIMVLLAILMKEADNFFGQNSINV